MSEIADENVLAEDAGFVLRNLVWEGGFSWPNGTIRFAAPFDTLLPAAADPRLDSEPGQISSIRQNAVAEYWARVRRRAVAILKSDGAAAAWHSTRRQLAAARQEMAALEARAVAARANAEAVRLEAAPGLGKALVAAEAAERNLSERRGAATTEIRALERAEAQAREAAAERATLAARAAKNAEIKEWKERQRAALLPVLIALREAMPAMLEVRAAILILSPVELKAEEILAAAEEPEAEAEAEAEAGPAAEAAPVSGPEAETPAADPDPVSATEPPAETAAPPAEPVSERKRRGKKTAPAAAAEDKAASEAEPLLASAAAQPAE